MEENKKNLQNVELDDWEDVGLDDWKDVSVEPVEVSQEGGITKEPDTSFLEAAARGTAEGLSLGFADEITGALEAGYETLLGKDKLENFLENYRKYRDESRREYEQAEKEYPTTFLASEIAGGIVPAIFTAGATAAPALAKTAAKQALKAGATKAGAKSAAGKALAKQSAKEGAMLGAAASLGATEADLTEGELIDAAKDVALGTATGGVLGAAAPAVAKGLGEGLKLTGKGIKKGAEAALRRTADIDEDIFKRILKDPTKVKEAGPMYESAKDLIERGNTILERGKNFAITAKSHLTDDLKYDKNYISSQFDDVINAIGSSDRETIRKLLNLKEDIIKKDFKGKDFLSEKDLQKALEDIYHLAWRGTKKDAPDAVKKGIRKVGNKISQIIKKDNDLYKSYMAESEKDLNFIQKLSDMYGMNKAGLAIEQSAEGVEEALEGSAIKYAQKLEFPGRKTDTAISNLKKVIDPKKIDDKNFIEEAVKDGFLTKDFAATNEARAIKEILEKNPNLKVGDLMSARALIGGFLSNYTGTFLPYATAVFAKPAARKLLLNMDKLGIKKGTKDAEVYLKKLIDSGALEKAMKSTVIVDTKDIVKEQEEYRKQDMVENILNMKQGDLKYLSDSLIEINKPLSNQLKSIVNKPESIRNSYLNKILSSPASLKSIKRALNKDKTIGDFFIPSVQAAELPTQGEQDENNNDVTMSDNVSEVNSKKKVENSRKPQSESIKKEVKQVYENIAKNFEEFSYDDIALIGGLESNHGKFKDALESRSSAKGLFQFVDSTRNNLKKSLEKKGIKITEDPYDLGNQEKLMTELLQQNLKQLKKFDNTPDIYEAYTMHLLGAPTGKKLLQSDDNTPTKDILSSRVIEYNPSLLKNKTVKEAKDAIKRYLEKQRGK